MFFQLVYYTLPVGSFKPLVLCHLWDIHREQIILALLNSAFQVCEESTFSYHIMLLQKREVLWIGFQSTEAQSKHLIPKEHFTEEQLNWPSYNRGLSRKKSRDAFHSKPPLVLVIFDWKEYTLKVASFKYFVLCHLWDCYAYCPSIPMSFLAEFGKRAIFHNKSAFSRKESMFGVGLKFLKGIANT